MIFDVADLRWDWNICVSSKFPGDDADDAVQGLHCTSWYDLLSEITTAVSGGIVYPSTW